MYINNSKIGYGRGFLLLIADSKFWNDDFKTNFIV